MFFCVDPDSVVVDSDLIGVDKRLADEYNPTKALIGCIRLGAALVNTQVSS